MERTQIVLKPRKKLSPEHIESIRRAAFGNKKGLGKVKSLEWREAQRQRMLGVRPSEATRKKMRDAKFIHGASRNTAPYNKWISEVKERDNHTCQNCGKTNLSGCDEHAHHKLSWERYPELRYEVSNGVTLCRSCHSKELFKK